jgi:hypothetical protein
MNVSAVAPAINDVELRLLVEAVYHAYHYDFRHYARASLRRRLAAAMVRFDCRTLSELQGRLLHESQVSLFHGHPAARGRPARA